MGLKDKQKSAARATAARLGGAKAQDCLADPTPLDNIIPETIDNTPAINISSDSDSDCGYEGGVNCYWSDSDDSDFSEEYSDAESLEELEGDELEANLLELRTELTDLGAPTKYDQIMELKLEKEWRKVEQNCALGYNGNSKQTQE
ncbi:hypothetical protein PILCRDRAFT_2013 [Piloderma croceum F 1598]|uniref:Uncharacterized protein n=1 Tax=Piloderma croceum (strain F 1598) TaxID=765440 RepID=A0A0C3GGD5_PILCF|nr:hypothetical protein PILCRDRAFT_2013 [Piloderma croceum F 1598]